MQCMSYIRPHYHGSLKLSTHAYYTYYVPWYASFICLLATCLRYPITTYLQYLHVHLLSVPCLPSLISYVMSLWYTYPACMAQQGRRNRGAIAPHFSLILKLNHVDWQNLVASNTHTADSDCDKKTL